MYRICATPEPAASLEERLTETGLDVRQPAQEPPSQEIAVAGGCPSAVTVKGVAEEVRPAPFVAVMSWGAAGSTAEASKL